MFITFEGPDGSGKTTQLALLAEYLKQNGHDVLTTREPGGTSVGEQIRQVLHDLKNKGMDARAELLLFSASRAQIVAEVMRPALKADKIVISDRFFDSTYAYQGYGHGLDLDVLKTITTFATGGLTPDMTVFFHLDPAEALARRKTDDAAEWTRMDDYEEAFHRRVAKGYQQLIAQEPERWVTINANQSIDALQSELRRIIDDALARRV